MANILFFLCLKDRGGAEISMVKLAQGLMGKGHRVTFAVYGDTGGYAARLAKELGFAGNVIDLNCARTLAAFMPLSRLLRQGQFDTVISAIPHTNLIAIAAAVLNAPKANIIVTEHGMEGIVASAASLPFRLLACFLYARADAVVAVSQALAQSWKKLSPRAFVTTIYNPVVDGVVAVLPSAHDWLAHKSLPVVMGVGRLKDAKNFGLLIRAFAVMVKTTPARLIIIGEGEQRPMLENLIRELGVTDNVLMPGFAAHPNAWLAYADLFVCPSKIEGFGNAIVEAMACGVSVVSTDCPCGPAEILEQGRYGALVPVDDAAAMAEAMARILAAPFDKNMLIARARHFTVTSCIDGYAALVDNRGLRNPS